MFSIGFWELVVVFIVALITLGPERLPVAAKVLGRWWARGQRLLNVLRNDIMTASDDTKPRH